MIGITNSNTSTIYVGPTEPTSGVRIWLDTDEDGASAVNSVNGKAGTVVLEPDDIGAAAEWTLVWENASTSSAFAAQTISLDLSEYTEVKIMFVYKGNTIPSICEICNIGGNNAAQWFFGTATSGTQSPLYSRRIFRVRTTGIEFDDNITKATNNTNAGSSNNDASMPFVIYAR